MMCTNKNTASPRHVAELTDFLHDFEDPQQLPPRRVHFSESFDPDAPIEAEVYVYDNVQSTDIGLLYCQKRDYQTFKKRAIKVAELVAEENKGKKPGPYTNAVLRAYLACCTCEEGEEIDRKDRQRLKHWVSCRPCRRGLEKYSMRALDEDRTHRRNLAVRAVVETQNADLGDDVDVQQSIEVLAQLYQYLSQSSKIFAQLMGEADAAAAKEQRYLKPPKTNNVDAMMRRKGDLGLVRGVDGEEAFGRIPGHHGCRQSERDFRQQENYRMNESRKQEQRGNRRKHRNKQSSKRATTTADQKLKRHHSYRTY